MTNIFHLRVGALRALSQMYRLSLMSQAKPAQQLIDAHDSPFFAQSGLLTMGSTTNKFQFWTIYFMLKYVSLGYKEKY